MPEDRYLATLDHEEVVIRRGKRSGLYTIVAVHSTARGPSLGGVRMWTYADRALALRDALRLSEGMTYKAAVAGLPQGGGKGVIVVPPGRAPGGRPAPRRAAGLRATPSTPLDGRYVTAEDVGITPDDLVVVAELHAARVRAAARPRRVRRPEPVDRARRAGLDRGRLRARVRHRRPVRPHGRGHGARPRRRRPRPPPRRRRRPPHRHRRRPGPPRHRGGARRRPGSRRTRSSPPTSTCSRRARWAASSTTRPCPSLRARVIAGAANNQLADPPSTSCSPSAGSSGSPDFVVNAGGIVNIAVEFAARRLRRGARRPRRARHRRHRPADPRRGRARRPHAAGRRDGDRPAAASPRAARTRPPALDRGQRAGGGGAAMPSGSRRSAASLRRWACMVSARRPRSAAGASDHAASSSASSPRSPRSSASTQPPLAVQPVREVLVELGRRRRARPGRGPGTISAQVARRAARAARRGSRPCRRPRTRCPPPAPRRPAQQTSPPQERRRGRRRGRAAA